MLERVWDASLGRAASAAGIVLGAALAGPLAGSATEAALDRSCLTSAELGTALLAAVRAQRFDETPDHGQNQGRAAAEMPSLDLSVIAFPAGCPPAYANVLVSRVRPRGHVAAIDAETLSVRGVRYLRDRRDPVTGESVLWTKGARWDEQALEDLVPGLDGVPFVVPYPASAVKLLPAIGVLRLVERGALTLDGALAHAGRTASVLTWLDEMITLSSNEATFALTRLLHEHGELRAEEPDEQLSRPCAERTERRETRNALHELLDGAGLRTLRYARTRPCDGSFFNSAGSGVGHHHMTSWDAVRLLWLLDPHAPPATWSVAGRLVDARVLTPESKRLLVERLLGEQALHEALSSTLTCGRAGRADGLPARLPPRWYADPAAGDYGVVVDGARRSDDARPCDGRAELLFAHKTGLTQNYGSDLGSVRGLGAVDDRDGPRRHYLIALFTSLGSRYAEGCEERGLCYTQRIPALGKAVDDFLRARLGP